MLNTNQVASYLCGRVQRRYKINELVQFSYPIQRLSLAVLATSKTDGDSEALYYAILSAVKFGSTSISSIIRFLGLSPEDSFIPPIIGSLFSMGLLSSVNGVIGLTTSGREFLDGSYKLYEEIEADFRIDLDLFQNRLCAAYDDLSADSLEKVFPSRNAITRQDELKAYCMKSFKLVSSEYARSSGNTLLDIQQVSLMGKPMFRNLWFAEYVNTKSEELPYIEVYYEQNGDIIRDDALSKLFQSNYSFVIQQLGEEERNEPMEILQTIAEPVTKAETVSSEENVLLTIWETKQEFIKALRNVKQKILIESPWIKKATMEYMPYFKSILEEGKDLVILYGIKMDNGDDTPTLEKLQALSKYPYFHLFFLPRHLYRSGVRAFSGSHRKILIKDNDFFISGSFNYLSFGRQEGQSVSNEESIKICQNVEERWQKINREYNLNLSL